MPKHRVQLSLIALSLVLSCSAETIRLKNGRTILADTVRENGNKIEYTVGEDTYAIAKSSVERIDTGGSPVVTRQEPAPAMNVDLSGLTNDTALEAQLIKDGKLDADLLSAIDAQGPPERIAAANFFASEHHRAAGRLAEAVRFSAKAKSALPENGEIAAHHAMLLAQLGRTAEAISAALDGVRLAPGSGGAHLVLGYCYYESGRLQEAIRELKKGLTLQPDKNGQALLAKAERELKAEGAFDEEASSHFALRYEGGQAPAALRRQLLDTLEQHYQDLTHDLDYLPHSPIQVVLYTDKQFFDVTRAPRWTGALNDGKLRIPISGVTAVDSNLARVLKHELAHSFINLITNGRAPTWVHEGIAQLEEPQSVSRDGRRLSMLYGSGHNIPLNQLEGSFIRFSESEAAVAYAQSLASAEYIREVYGMSSLSFLLKRMGEGQSTESALRAAVHAGYADFDRDLALWLKKNYE